MDEKAVAGGDLGSRIERLVEELLEHARHLVVRQHAFDAQLPFASAGIVATGHQTVGDVEFARGRADGGHGAGHCSGREQPLGPEQ